MIETPYKGWPRADGLGRPVFGVLHNKQLFSPFIFVQNAILHFPVISAIINNVKGSCKTPRGSKYAIRLDSNFKKFRQTPWQPLKSML